MARTGWLNCEDWPSKVYTCNMCGKEISSNKGYAYFEEDLYGFKARGHIYICHNCNFPTYFDYTGKQIPGGPYGEKLTHLPKEIEQMYNESRNCFSINAFTSSVLCCRKLLMNITCEKGAKPGEKFEYYVNYLDTKGYIPPDGKSWVNEIRKLGNQATHKIEIKLKEDAELSINFTSMLLKFVYEFPRLLKK